MKRIYLLLFVAVLLVLFGLKQEYGNSQTSIMHADSLWLDSASFELQELKQLGNETRELYRKSQQQPDSIQAKDSITPEQLEKARKAIQKIHEKKAAKARKRFWREVGDFLKAWFGL